MTKLLIALPLVALLLLAGAIAFGGPGEPAPMAGINAPFTYRAYALDMRGPGDSAVRAVVAATVEDKRP